jgi:preprotein translocase subunit SecA
MQYLQAIDRKWLDHLENMEALREAVYLRSYGQKNPLTEYKIEGFQIFETMIDDIRQEIASRVHLVRVQSADNREVRARPVATIQSASHGSVGSFAGAAAPANTSSSGSSASAIGTARPSGPSSRSEPESVTVVRSYPKVGRNDPCPCGSGKKYKYCHGK